MRVLLAEDHPLMQQAIAALLVTEHVVIAIVARGDELLDSAALHEPEIVVLDVSLPGRSGLQVLPHLRRHHPRSAIVVLTTFADPMYQMEAKRRGADGYVLKGNAAVELLPAMERAVVRRTAILHDLSHYA